MFHHEYKENIEITKKVVEYAKKYNVSVEAELGRVGGQEDNAISDGVVYADVEKDGYNIDPVQIEKVLSERKDIKAIVPVHIAGLPCNMDAICEIASRYNIPVIEDAAHAFPSKTKKGYAGTLGDIGVFSLLSMVVFKEINPLFTLISVVSARVLSSFINYFINFKITIS